MSLRIGIDLGGTKIEGVALAERAEVARIRVDTPRDDYLATLAAVAAMVGELEQRTSSPGSRIPAPGSRLRPSVGIGIPGTVSSSGRVKNANSTWLIGEPLQADLESQLDRPVRVANDANCFAMSEAIDGAGAECPVVFGVIIGTGVGGGLVVNQRLVTGPNGIAGEWGHNPLPWADADETPGPDCYCGKRGCIETFLSGPGMTADHERRAGARLSPPDIVALAADGDAQAEATLARYERRLARALAAIINVLDPDVIVLGGGLSNMARLYGNVPRLWRDFVFAASDAPEPVRTALRRAQHGDTSGVRGAAWLWP